MKNKPYWWPVLINEDYFNRLRKDYPEDAYLSDEELNEYYNELGRKYSVLWDNIGDAYEDYEPLADEFFKLQSKLDLAIEALDRLGGMEAFWLSRSTTDHPADKELTMRIDYARETLIKLKEGEE